MNTTDLAFDEIFLSRKDMRTLKKAEKTIVSTELCEDLLLLGFVEEVKTHIPGYRPKSNGTAQITALGSRYLKYIKEKRNKIKGEHLHDWLIPIFSVLGGALLSKPIWNGIDCLIKWVSENF